MSLDYPLRIFLSEVEVAHQSFLDLDTPVLQRCKMNLFFNVVAIAPYILYIYGLIVTKYIHFVFLVLI